MQCACNPIPRAASDYDFRIRHTWTGGCGSISAQKSGEPIVCAFLSPLVFVQICCCDGAPLALVEHGEQHAVDQPNTDHSWRPIRAATSG